MGFDRGAALQATRSVFCHQTHIGLFPFWCDGVRRPSRFRVYLEVGINGHVGLLAINAVEYPCPPLLSKHVCSALGLQLDCGSGRFDLHRLGVRSQHFTSSAEGHYLLRIDEFIEHWPSWHQLLQQGHCPKIQHDEVSMFELRKGVPVGKGVRRIQAQGRDRVRTPVLACAPTSKPRSDSRDHGSRSADQGSTHSGAHRGTVRVVGGTSSGRAGLGGRGGGQDPTTAAASEAGGRDSLGCYDGECASCLDRGNQSQVRAEEQDQGQFQDQGQEGDPLGDHRPVCGLSRVGNDPQPRCSVQHELGAARPAGGALPAGVAPALPSGHGILRTPLETPSSLAGHDDEQGGGGHLGAFGRRCEDLERPSGSAAAEVRGEAVANGGSEPRRATPWKRSQVQVLKRGAKCCSSVLQHLAFVAHKSTDHTWRVLEIFGGSAALSLIARSTGKWCALEPVDLVYGSDVLDPKERKRILQQIDEWEPDLVCLEPPCGPWSSLQSLNPQEVVHFKRMLRMPFWEFCAVVWKKQHRAGRPVLLERPFRSMALKLDCMIQRPSVHRAVVDQCMFGLQDQCSHLPFQKRTALDVNSPVFAAALMQGSLCDRSHSHQTIEGQVFAHGKWMNRSLVAGTWTPQFGRHILACAALALSQAGCWHHTMLMSLSPASTRGMEASASCPDHRRLLRVTRRDAMNWESTGVTPVRGVGAINAL